MKTIQRILKFLLRKSLSSIERKRFVSAIQEREKALRRRKKTISHMYKQRYILREKVDSVADAVVALEVGDLTYGAFAIVVASIIKPPAITEKDMIWAENKLKELKKELKWKSQK